jgi:hypothetical protein
MSPALAEAAETLGYFQAHTYLGFEFARPNRARKQNGRPATGPVFVGSTECSDSAT